MKAILLSLFSIAGLFCFTNSLAQNQIFIKAYGTPGDGSNTPKVFDGGSTAEGHQNEIDAIAYTDGMAGCASLNTGGGGGACKVSQSPFTFSMPISAAVISFKYNLLVGKLINSVDMVIRKSSEGRGLEYYKVHMEEVLITSISEGAGPDDPVFNIELLPTKIAWQFIKQNSDGQAGDKFSYGWDFRQNRKFTYVF